jgi:hypothetical protein
VINGIQTGPYKNIYNPENFFVGKNGVGAANNWGDGYQTGESVHEDIMEMIDREADGSDSLEVRDICREGFVHMLTNIGLHDASFDSRRYWIWSRLVPPRKTKRPLSQENNSDIFGISRYDKLRRCCCAPIQQFAFYAKVNTKCGLRCGA